MMDAENLDATLPVGWIHANMEDVCDIIMGQSPRGDSYNQDAQGIPLINGPVEFGPTPFSNTIRSKFTTKPTKLCRKNDLLLCVRGSTTGRMNIAGFDACIGRGVAAIRSSLCQSYINYFINFKQPQIFNMGTGSTFPNVTIDMLRSIIIPTPPLAEQYRIVSRIEELFSRLEAGVEALEKAKPLLQRYRQAVLKAAVEGRLTEEWRKGHPDNKPAESLYKQSNIENHEYAGSFDDNLQLWDVPENWQWTKLGMCSELITKGESPKWQGFNYVEQGILFIRSENVLWGDLDISNSVKIPLEFHRKLKRSVVRPNDVLINLVGASIGRCGVIPASIQEANINQAVATIRVKEILLPYYLMYLLISPKMQKEIQGNKVETARPNISLGDLKYLNIPLPPIFEQKKIVDEIEYKLYILNNLDPIIESDIHFIAHLRQSILKNAFEGKLVPQDPNDEPASALLEMIKAERAIHAPKRGKRINSKTTPQTRLTQ